MTPHIHSRTFGHGPRNALAIHCSLAHSGAWRGVGDALADVLTLLAYDLPSHGKSGNWDGQGDVHDVATAMGRALLTDRMDLIGHSFGAVVALQLAIEVPELVRSLTLIEPVYQAAVVRDAPERMAIYDAANAPFIAAAASGDKLTAARTFNRIWGDGTPWAEIPEATRQYMIDRIHFVPASTPFLRDDSAGLLAPGRFGRAAMPTLLVEGSDAPDISAAINASLARRLPDATRAVIDGAGHMAPLTHPDKVAEAIRALLDRTH